MSTIINGPVKYTVLVGKRIRGGTAKTILEMIRRDAAKNAPEIADMTVDGYANALIEDANYFVDADVLKQLKGGIYPSKFDKALVYLAAMPSSQVTILPPRFLRPG